MNETSLDYLIENKDAFTEYQLAKAINDLVEQGWQKKKIYESLKMGHSKFYDLLAKYRRNELKDCYKPTIKTDIEVKASVKDLLLKKYTKTDICNELHIGMRRLNKILAIIEEEKKEKEETLCSTNIMALLDRNINDKVNLEQQLLSYYNKVISVWDLCDKLDITIEELNSLILRIERKNRENGIQGKINIKDKTENFTLVDKIIYANATYGYAGWHFISREELKSLLKCDKI